MGKILFGSLILITCLSINNASAECPPTITHDDARAIANGENNPFMGIYEPVGDMKEMVVKKGLSKGYTNPHLVNSAEAVGDRLVCTYTYEGKLTGRSYTFKINIPDAKHK
ncbi:MAG: hypothetical protein Q8L85_04375 [Alphaproteobacteria bacterium]|nr:hypothetical protein [Alphaproteobacteria bacterium]